MFKLQYIIINDHKSSITQTETYFIVEWLFHPFNL